MEAALGANFADVRVYVGPQAERIGAIAFTVGSDIYFAPSWPEGCGCYCDYSIYCLPCDHGVAVRLTLF
jgi:hypothetical protein